MADPPPKILVRPYIDALNLYYGVAKENHFKWIDIKGLLLELIQSQFPNAEVEFEIEKIYLFTAEIRGDAEARSRQHTYLSALSEAYGDSLVVVKGRMINVSKRGVLDGRVVTIDAYEEKKTDVNIACQIAHDACINAVQGADDKDFHVACLVSNDSDLGAPLIIKKKLKQRVLLMFPLAKKNMWQASSDLKKYVPKKDRIPCIPRSVLLKHRLPLQVGQWHCPKAWKEQDEEERKRNNELLPE